MYKIVSWLVGVFALTCCVMASTAFATEQAGDRAVDRGEYRVAIREYEDALANDPDDVAVLIKLVRTKTRLAEQLDGAEAERLHEDAAEHARTATEVAPENPEAHFERARALGRLSQFRGVLQTLGLAGTVKEELDRTLELDPDHAGAYHALALWHHNVPGIAGGHRSEVEPLFERAIEIEPQNVSHRLAYGEVLLEFGELEAACGQLRAAMEIEVDTFVGRTERERARELYEENC